MMTKDEFHKEMQELAEDKFGWSEIGDDYYMLYLENDYVAIELVENGTFAVECENGYTKNHKSIEAAKEDVLSLISAICNQEIDLCLD